MDKKVDVIVQSYGKSEQLRCTLESLYTHSSQWIDKIYLIEEKERPFNDKDCKWVTEYFENIEYHKPKNYINPYTVPCSNVPYDLIRHQWGIDKSDKKYVFICHNDVLFTGDIIGNMINEIINFENNNPNEILAGIGSIGQCHNCPALDICGGGEKWNKWEPTWEDINNLKLPHIRTRKDNLHKTIPKLMPECRLNEFACIINKEITIEDTNNLFGQFSEDSGVNWFRFMYEKGYKFIDYRKDFHHGYWSPKMGGSGFQTQQNKEAYFEAEEAAKKYFEEHFAKNFE